MRREVAQALSPVHLVVMFKDFGGRANHEAMCPFSVVFKIVLA